MMGRLLVGCLFVVIGNVTAATPEGPGALPKAEADQWAGRIQRLLHPGWSVATRGNDLIIQRDKPVRFAQVQINALAWIPTGGN